MTDVHLRDPAPGSDPYRWLEMSDDDKVIAWTEEQEGAYKTAANAWRSREAASARLADLSAQLGALSAPRPAGDRLFLTRLVRGADHPQLVVVESDGMARVLLDPARLDPGGTTTLERWEPSWEGSRLAYQVASGGTENSDLYVLDVDSATIIDGPIDRVRRTTVAWLPDSSGFYYVRRKHPHLVPGEGRYHRRIYVHTIGADPDTDSLIFGEGREKTQHYAVHTSPDGRWLIISAAAGTAPRKDVWIADLAASCPRRPLLQPVQEGIDARSTVQIRSGTSPTDTCYVTTNLGASHGRLAIATPADPRPGTWRDLISEDSQAVLEDFAVLDGADLDRPVIMAVRTRHAISEVAVHDAADGTWIGTVAIPPCGTVGALRAAATQAHEAWFVFTNFTTPGNVYHFDARSRSLTLWPVPGATGETADSGPLPTVPIETRQVEFLSSDGTTVRMFVIAAAGGPDLRRPTILTGYGGFGQSMTPSYSPEAIAWVESGGVYAVANIRGGAEEGEDWHRAGMRERKQNSFADFEAAADHLVADGWTTPGQLGIWGSSNGGLLVGAAITRHPEKYAAAACLAPLLDMARYEQSGMGPSWADEYGTAADPEQLRWLMAYSPYHHVRPGTSYPAVMFAVFDGDTRVDPLHARKMCAALQHASSSGNPLLYRLERGSGHGARSMSRRTVLFADLLAFFADRLGLSLTSGPATSSAPVSE